MTTTIYTNNQDDLAIARKAAIGGRRVLFVGVGTTGHKLGLQFEGWLVRIFGRVPDSVRILVFDVDTGQESLLVDPRGRGERQEITLPPEVEFFVLGRGLDLTRLAREAALHPELHEDELCLIHRQPDGRLPKTTERGAENEPLVGLIVWRSELRRIIEILLAALRSLQDLRLPGEEGAGGAMTVFVAGSIAGGCGSPLLLPAAKEIREAMEDIGIDPSRCLFIELAVMPEAFPESRLRLAVSWSTLMHHNAAFVTGTLPFADENTPPGGPFDLALLCAPVTESGRTLRGIDDLASALALSAVLLGAYPLREASAARLSNLSRKMEERLPNGEARAFGIVGVSSYRFAAPRVTSYCVDRLVELLVDELLEDHSHLVQGLGAAAFNAHFTDLDALLGRLQRDDEGEELLGSFATEARKELRRRRERGTRLLERLEVMEATFIARRTAAAVTAQRTMTVIEEQLASFLDETFQAALNDHGPAAGLIVMEEECGVIQQYRASLTAQREAIKLDVAARETALVEAGTQLRAAAGLGLLGRVPGAGSFARRDVKASLQTYLEARDAVFHGDFALDRADTVLQAFARLLKICEIRRSAGQARRQTLVAARHRSRERQRSFEESLGDGPLVERPLHEPEDIRGLFADVLRCEWSALSPEVFAVIRKRAGDLFTLLGESEDEVDDRLRAAALPEVKRVAEMTADDYLGWLLERRGVEPKLFLRDALLQAAPLCRYERTRLPTGDDLADSTFHLVGVPDPERSAFVGLADVLLVATGDPERLAFLTVKVGLPASALWRAPKYRRAYAQEKAAGRVALDIYPGFPPITPRTGTKRRTANRAGRSARGPRRVR